jgi:hypothetical protein
MSFGNRSRWHDEIARPILDTALKPYGLKTIDHGIETNKELSKILGPINTEDSRKLRQRPDYVITDEKNILIMADLKSEFSGYPNFSIEAWPFAIAKMFHPSSYIVGVDVKKKTVGMILASALPEPKEVRFPEVADVKENKLLLRKYFHESTKFVDKEPPEYNASGTPYILLPKTYFADIDLVIPKIISSNTYQEPSPRTVFPLNCFLVV